MRRALSHFTPGFYIDSRPLLKHLAPSLRHHTCFSLFTQVTHPYVSRTQGGKVDFPPKHAIPGQKTDLYRAEALLLWLSTYSYIPAVSKFLRPMDGCGGSGRAISPSSYLIACPLLDVLTEGDRLRSSSETVRERAETNSRSSRSSCRYLTCSLRSSCSPPALQTFLSRVPSLPCRPSYLVSLSLLSPLTVKMVNTSTSLLSFLFCA